MYEAQRAKEKEAKARVEQQEAAERRRRDEELAVQRRQAERINELQWRQYYEQVEQVQKENSQDAINARVAAWRKRLSGGPQTLVADMLAALHQIFPYQGVEAYARGELQTREAVKKLYMKILLKLHPDRLPQDATVEMKLLANALFSLLRDAFNEFMSLHS